MVLFLISPTRAEIHVGDPYVRAALEDYAQFALQITEVSKEETPNTAPIPSEIRDTPKPGAEKLASGLKKEATRR